MAVYRCNITFQTTTGVPADKCVNTMWFDDGEIGVPMLELIADDLVAFFDTIQDIYSVYTPKAGHTFDFYKQSDPEPRAPAYSAPWEFTVAPTGTVLPLEVACVMSYQGDPISGVNQQTRRNRIYLGPLSNIVVASSGRFDASIPPLIAGAGADLIDASLASGYDWVAFSTKLNTGTLVTNGWVDNEPDTQRRRGRDATLRSTFS
uniref:Uncharacterized protein n=1 Tax=uncultured prokaryote TaxID=198431 RepID=A0A0H5Q5V9_9ZZZZ|nr:hypothetical protein [uncultured prokaryote]